MRTRDHSPIYILTSLDPAIDKGCVQSRLRVWLDRAIVVLRTC